MVGCYTRIVGRWSVDGSGGGRPAVTRLDSPMGYPSHQRGLPGYAQIVLLLLPRGSSPRLLLLLLLQLLLLLSCLHGLRVPACAGKGHMRCITSALGLSCGRGSCPACQHYNTAFPRFPRAGNSGNNCIFGHPAAHSTTVMETCTKPSSNYIPASFQNRGPWFSNGRNSNACQHADQTGK